jgi:uncharacterized protein YneF (UPF0154 family)
VRQLLVESLVLSLIGGIGGMLIARWTLPGLLALSPIDENYWGTIGLDRTVLVFGFALSCVTGLLFGLVPALQVTRIDLSQSTREGGRASASRAAGLFRQALIVLEVATSVTLLIGALLLTRTFMNLMAVSPGLESHSLRHALRAWLRDWSSESLGLSAQGATRATC